MTLVLTAPHSATELRGKDFEPYTHQTSPNACPAASQFHPRAQLILYHTTGVLSSALALELVRVCHVNVNQILDPYGLIAIAPVDTTPLMVGV